MKGEFDILFSQENSDIEYVAENFKAASDKDKEKIYNISKRKYKIMKSEGAGETDDGYINQAEGVERYRRPVWRRWIYATAASVILIGAVSGGIMLAGSHKIGVSTETQQSTDANSGKVLSEEKSKKSISDMESAANDLIDSWLKLQRIQFGDDVDQNDEVTYMCGETDASNEYKYYKVTAEGINDFKSFDKLLSSTYSGYVYSHFMGGDFSDYPTWAHFGIDSSVEPSLKRFIKYGDAAYSQWQPDYAYINSISFDRYELVSSEFIGAEEFDYKSSAFCEWYQNEGEHICKFTSPEFYDTFSELVKKGDFQGIYDTDYEDVTLCRRVYKNRDDETSVMIYADFLLIEQDSSWKIANFSIKGEYERLEQYPDNNTEYINTADNTEEKGNIQPYERIVYADLEEAEKISAMIEEKYMNGEYEFVKADTEKYIMNMTGNEADINSHENKSFIYHMLWNSYRYFDTAEAEYDREFASKDIKKISAVKVAVNNRENYIDYTDDCDDIADSVEYYRNGNSEYIINKNDKVYSRNSIDDTWMTMYDYVPDNNRIIYYKSDFGVTAYKVFGARYYNGYASDCLYFDAVRFEDFDKWNIKGLAEVLGRECAVVEYRNDTNDCSEHIQCCVDLRTGIVLEYENNYHDNGTIEEYTTTKIKSIKIDELIEKKMPDMTGYTEKK
ncbi:MAG: hypothetical protein K5898_03785 [Ruminococcus sp.]|uniref:hypothetical protein n=1 Tax=Ruminococcus sp. TaxID=41978 RepID=UPI0025EEC1DF|nr:hypothetical protein [Ruminococcus sp.]MCR4794287.1 hypothetical protein [Ruminococcus sp.]